MYSGGSIEEGTPTTTKLQSRQPRSPKPAHSSDTEERIRRRAYELYEQRGKADGFALNDWLQAEREILEARQHFSGVWMCSDSLVKMRVSAPRPNLQRNASKRPLGTILGTIE
jgi:hypothetical protein